MFKSHGAIILAIYYMVASHKLYLAPTHMQTLSNGKL